MGAPDGPSDLLLNSGGSGGACFGQQEPPAQLRCRPGSPARTQEVMADYPLHRGKPIRMYVYVHPFRWHHHFCGAAASSRAQQPRVPSPNPVCLMHPVQPRAPLVIALKADLLQHNTIEAII
jgi:hypothetical protein